jgi:hypothetical protein
MMNDDPLAKAFGSRRGELAIFGAHFSADGKFLSFVVGWTETGYGANQAWLYDMSAKRLFAATDMPHADNGYAFNNIIEQTAFSSDDTLYVSGERIVPQDQSKNSSFKIAATTHGSREITDFPAGIAAQMKTIARWSSRSYSDVNKREVRNELYIVAAVERGSGPEYDLTMRRKEERKSSEIATGTESLLNFVFDPVRSLVYYDGTDFQGADGHGVEGIVVYDLKTTQKTTIPVGNFGLYDMTPDGDVIAYAAADACGRVPPTTEHQTTHICFVKLR